MGGMDERATPARPHQKLTADGRRMREVLSYSRRGNRFTPTRPPPGRPTTSAG